MSERPQNKHLKPFQPGESGNPLGGKLHNPEMRAVRRLCHTDLHEVVDLIVTGDMAGLQDAAYTKGNSVLKVWIATVALKAIQKGEIGPLEVLLNRVLGKPKESVELSGTVTGDLSERVIAMRKALAELKDEPKP